MKNFWCERVLGLALHFTQLQFLDANFQPRYALGSIAAELNTLVFIHGTLTVQDDTNLWHFGPKKNVYFARGRNLNTGFWIQMHDAAASATAAASKSLSQGRVFTVVLKTTVLSICYLLL